MVWFVQSIEELDISVMTTLKRSWHGNWYENDDIWSGRNRSVAAAEQVQDLLLPLHA